MNSTVIGFLPGRKARSEFAELSRHCRGLVADHVIASFLRRKNGERLISTDANKQTPSEREALAEACMYADPEIVGNDKAGKVDSAFKEFLGLGPVSQADEEDHQFLDNWRATKNRLIFLTDNFHLLPKDLKIHADNYLKENEEDTWAQFINFGNKLRGDEAKNLQRCENLLNMSFAKPTKRLIATSLHNGSSADGIAKYVPHLKAEIAEQMAKTILFTKPSDETMKMSLSYPSTLDSLIQNISCFSRETSKQIKDDFEQALRELTGSMFFGQSQPLKVKGSFRFYRMCEAIDKLPQQEQHEWKFITRYRDKYVSW